MQVWDDTPTQSLQQPTSDRADQWHSLFFIPGGRWCRILQLTVQFISVYKAPNFKMMHVYVV